MRNLGIGIVAIALVAQWAITGCVQDPEEGLNCPFPIMAELDSIKQVFYSPYANNRYSKETDTVRFEDFLLTAEFGFEPISNKTNPYEQTYPGACPRLFNVQNVSNIELYLTSPFGSLRAGTEVSYLFALSDGTMLNRYRDFKRMNQFLSLKLKEKPVAKTQVNTRLVVYFRDGSSISIASNSPFVK